MVKANNNKNQRGGGEVKSVEKVKFHSILSSDNRPYIFENTVKGAVIHNYGSDTSKRAFSHNDDDVKI
jgi:hypothetical protein